MHSQVAEQAREAALAADQADRFGQVQCRFDQAMSDRLGYRIGNADGERKTLSGRLVARDFEQFVAEREYFFSVAEDAPASVGEFQTAAS